MSKKVLVSLDMNKNEIQNVVMQSLATAPASPEEGQYYYNSADVKAYQYVRTSASGIAPATYAWKPLGGAEITVDSAMSDSSTNPVQNKVVKKAIGDAIAALPKEQFLDLTKTTFVQSFVWSSTSYPGSTNPSLEGKPVLVLALKNSSNNTVAYSFLNMYELVDTYTADSPIKVSGRKITHETSGVSAGSYGQASNATPAFGDTFNVPYITENATGHATKVETHTVKIPDTVATSNQNGLMSTNDVTRLDYLTKHSIQKKTATLSAGSKVASITVSPEEQADIVQVLVTTPDNELVIADVTTDGSGSNVSVVIAQPYSANLTITIWYIVTE